jgi:excisionase family DNA binding protein
MKRWLTVADAAKYMGVHSHTIHNWIAEGRLPASKAGPRLVRVDLADLDQLLEPIPTVKAS